MLKIDRPEGERPRFRGRSPNVFPCGKASCAFRVSPCSARSLQESKRSGSSAATGTSAPTGDTAWVRPRRGSWNCAPRQAEGIHRPGHVEHRQRNSWWARAHAAFTSTTTPRFCRRRRRFLVTRSLSRFAR